MTTEIKPTTNGQTSKAPATDKRVPAVSERQDPFHSMRRAMNRLFDDFSFGLPSVPHLAWQGVYVPQINLAETETSVVATAELPGMDVKNIEVNLIGDNLIIKGEKKEEKEEKTVGYHSYERSYGSFERGLRLPCEVEREKIEATYKNGVLQVTLPKSKAAQANNHKIEIKKA